MVSQNSTARARWTGLAALILALWGAVGEPLGAQEVAEPLPRLSNARVAAQIGLGTILTPIAFFGTGWLTDRLFEPDPQGNAVRVFQYAASFTAAAAGAAAGPALAGSDGRFDRALLGSVAGLGGAFLTAKLGNALFDDGRRRCNVLCWSLGALTVAMPAIGATIAYNASRE